MHNNTPRRWGTLAVLVIVSALLMVPGRPKLAAAQHGPPPPAALAAPDTERPGRLPNVDIRPLLDAQRLAQAHDLKATVQPANDQQIAVAGLLSGAAGRPLGQADAIGAAQQGQGCTQMLLNPELTDGTHWLEYNSRVVLEPEAYTSAPHSFRLVEQDSSEAGGDGLNGFDTDSFGQVLNIPADTQQINLSFNVFDNILDGGFSQSDTLYYGFYSLDGDATLVAELGLGSVVRFNDNNWHTVTDTINEEVLIESLRQAGRVALVFYTVTDGIAPNLDISVDDIYAELCVGSSFGGSISGQVTQNTPRPAGESGYSDAELLLTKTPAGGPIEPVALVYANDDGSYSFTNVPALESGAVYQVWYVNEDNTQPDRLYVWAGEQITSFVADQQLQNANLNISNIELLSPAPESSVVVTPGDNGVAVTFSWGGRGPDGAHLAGDTYQFCLYDIETLDEVCSTQRLALPQITIGVSSFENALPPFVFEYDRRYAWYITVFGSSYVEGSLSEIGVSYGANTVIFVTEAITPPNNPPPTGGEVPPVAETKDWTVLVYIAGDNNLGDLERYPNPNGNLQKQWESLQQLAPSVPNVNLVTLTDFFGNTGTQFCHLKVDGRACEELGEQDTASPAVLTDFLNRGLERFPARHTMLVIQTHGHTIYGVGRDETTSATAEMTPDGIAKALKNANLDAPERKLDILFYNACLMGSFEAAYDASRFADFMVASANEVLVLNVYTRLVPLLTGSATPQEVAIGTVKAYKDALTSYGGGYFVSSAAYNLSQVATVNTALKALGIEMKNSLPGERARIQTQRSAIQVYDSSGNFELGSEDAFVDLKHMARVMGGAPGLAIAASANDLFDAVTGLVIANEQVSGRNVEGQNNDLSKAEGGIAIFFPNGSDEGGQQDMTSRYLNSPAYATYASNTDWDDFVRAYVTGNLAAGPGRIGGGRRTVDGVLPPNQNLIFLPLVMR